MCLLLSTGMTSPASSLVARLLENDEEDVDLGDMLRTYTDEIYSYPAESAIAKIPGIRKRPAYGGFSSRWYLFYGNWKFTVDVGTDGNQWWCAYYKTPTFDWDSAEDRKRGWRFGGGGMPVRLARGYNPSFYVKKLKAMADSNPDPWKARNVPPMPDPYVR